ncbi:MAG: hypothetical protein R6U17_09920 [Thermoplasmata archaeon]
MSSDDNIICPVCDANIPRDSKKCPVCGVDLQLFELEGIEPEGIESKEKMNDIIDILREDVDEDEFIERIKNLGGEANESISIDEGLLIFECPVCGENVEKDDICCSNCGAVFEDKEDDEGLMDAEKVKAEKTKEKLETVIDEIKSALSECRATPLDITVLKKRVKRVVKAKKEEDYDKGIDLANEALDISEKILTVNSLLVEAKERLKKLKDYDLDFKPYLKDMRNLKSEADQGKLDESIQIMRSMIEDMDVMIKKHEDHDKWKKIKPIIGPKLKKADDIIDDIENSQFSIKPIVLLRIEIARDIEKGMYDGLVEKVDRLLELLEKTFRVKRLFEARKSRSDSLEGEDVEDILEQESTLQIKTEGENFNDVADHFSSNINSLEDALSELEAKRESLRKIDDTILKLKKLVTAAADSGIEVEHLKNVIKNAKDLASKKEYEDARSMLENGEKRFVKTVINKVQEKVVSIEDLVKEVGKEDIVKGDLEMARKAVEDEDHISALKSISSAEKAVEEIDMPASADDFIMEREIMIEDAENIGFEVSTSKDLLKQAKKMLQEGNEDKAMEKADDAADEILDQVPYQLKSFVAKAKSDLKRAKISGVDISRPVMFLKEAKFANKEDNFEKCFKYMNRYNEFIGRK